ncbi:MAG: outer membrane lipoprotein carrier protein LolA [Nitrospirae bacterium]|nr:outer membrane lipoprotein carrier protein LolA [Nitrospirota bacterium]MBF0533804.1 outer membrane lipoprotein carrier protein LolA [Nitrospirota bacterium]MBF0615487.1 outer membrane lipoprotein carrier protein LolA [Nitrospirota bacterium]
MKKILIVFILLITSSTAFAAKPFVSVIKDYYESVKDIRGSFVQLSKLKDLEKELTYSGSFYIKPPKRMSWRYEGNESQEVYINEGELIIYQKKNAQAFRSKYDERTIGQTPLALLRGFKDVQTNYNVEEKDGVIRFTPKQSNFNLRYFDIYPSKEGFPIKKIVVYDKNENVVELTLSGVRINTGLEDSLFKFTPPSGLSIIDN